MTEKMISKNDIVNKEDLKLILEVNRKAIEIETAGVSQNEEILESLSIIKNNESNVTDLLKRIEENEKKSSEKLEKITEKLNEIDKDLFRIQVLFVSGAISLVIQIIQMFISFKN